MQSSLGCRPFSSNILNKQAIGYKYDLSQARPPERALDPPPLSLHVEKSIKLMLASTLMMTEDHLAFHMKAEG